MIFGAHHSMQISIANPIEQTVIFVLISAIFFALSYTPKKNYSSLDLTQELKGLAILCIIWAHIGYGLSTNQSFLFPLSILSGVSVNLFLFLSGYGLTASQLKREGTIYSFYKKRLTKIFIPFWIVLIIFLVLDYIILSIHYSPQFIIQSLIGIFNSASMFTDFNSPLWYFSLILLYYLLFPLIFFKRYPWVSAIFLYLTVWFLVQSNFEFLEGVIGLYEVHMLAFPLGIIAAWLVSTKASYAQSFTNACSKLSGLSYYAIITILLFSISYFALHGNIGSKAILEESTSIGIMFAIILLFILKKRESKLLSLFGLYSYEIYLFHWPLLSRYDLLYKELPAWLVTLLYLFIFIAIAVLFKQLSDFISQKIKHNKTG